MTTITPSLLRKLSAAAASTEDEFFSIPDSEPPSSVIRLAHLMSKRDTDTTTPTVPALPPKPSFGRSDTFIIHRSSSPSGTTDTTTATTTATTTTNTYTNANVAASPAPPPPLPPKPRKFSAPRSRDDLGLHAATVLDDNLNVKQLLHAQVVEPIASGNGQPLPPPLPPHPDRRTDASDAIFPDRADTDTDPLPVRLLTADAVVPPARTPGTHLLIPRRSVGSDAGIPLPFAAPPFTARDRALSVLLLPLRAPSPSATAPAADADARPAETFLQLSQQGMEDVDMGAYDLNLHRRRRAQQKQFDSLSHLQSPLLHLKAQHHDQDQQPKQQQADGDNHFVTHKIATPPHLTKPMQYDKLFLTPPSFQPPPMAKTPPPLPPQPTKPLPPIPPLSPSASFSQLTRLSLASSPDAHPHSEEDVWNVLRDYLTNNSLGPQGRARALRILASAACNLGNKNILMEIVNRMNGTDRSERDGSVFTLLIHVATSGKDVPVRSVFSDVVEEMHGRQDDHVMWERALRCFLILTGKSAAVSSVGGLSMSFSSSSNISLPFIATGAVSAQSQGFPPTYYGQQDYEYDLFEYDFLQQQQQQYNQYGLRPYMVDDYQIYREDDDFEDAVVIEQDHNEHAANEDGDTAKDATVIVRPEEENIGIDKVTTECIVALALHVGDLAHSNIDHVLITKCLCSRLRGLDAENYQDFDDTNDPMDDDYNVDATTLRVMGGVEVLTRLLVDTPSISARHTLFGIILDRAIHNTLETLEIERNATNDVNNETDSDEYLVLKDHVTVLRSFVHAHEVADLLVHAFRVGPWKTFVPDLMRLLIVQPLTNGLFASSDSFHSNRQSTEDSQRQSFEQDKLVGVEQTLQKASGRESIKKANQEVAPNSDKDQEMKQKSAQNDPRSFDNWLLDEYREPSARYIGAVTTVVKHLNKQLFLHVFRRIQCMAQNQATALHRRETTYYNPREWRILKQTETLILNLYRRSFCLVPNCPDTSALPPSLIESYSGGAQRLASGCSIRLQDVHHVLQRLYAHAIDLTSERVSARAVVRFAELVIELYTVRLPFSTSGKVYGGIHQHHDRRRRRLHYLHHQHNNPNLYHINQNQPQTQNQTQHRNRHRRHPSQAQKTPQHHDEREQQRAMDAASRDSAARLFLNGHVVAFHAMLDASNPLLFTALLAASRQHASVKRVSENRQCLIEFLGASSSGTQHLKGFTEDDDAAVAYRARELISKYADPSHARNPSLSTNGE